MENAENLVELLNHYIMLLEEDIRAINEDSERMIYPDGQKMGIVTALKDLQTCIDIYTDGEIKGLNYDPDMLLVGRL